MDCLQFAAHVVTGCGCASPIIVYASNISVSCVIIINRFIR